MRTLRFALLLAVCALASFLAISEAWSALQSGTVSLPLGKRRWSLITLARTNSPIGFHFGVAFWVAMSGSLGAVVLWASSVLVAGKAAQKEAMASGAIAQLERKAPSGLRPLWVGLAVAAACSIIYAAAAA